MERQVRTLTCTKCGAQDAADSMLSKTVRFVQPGRRGRVVRSRTVALLCLGCAQEDEAWNKPMYSNSTKMIGRRND